LVVFCRAPTGLLLFLFSMGMLEGLDGDEISEKIRTLWIPILIANWQASPGRPFGWPHARRLAHS